MATEYTWCPTTIHVPDGAGGWTTTRSDDRERSPATQGPPITVTCDATWWATWKARMPQGRPVTVTYLPFHAEENEETGQ
jgi:hypothetical protein